MNKTWLILVILMLLGGGAVLAEDYRLGPGDVLDISVWGHDDLQLKSIAVRPDGKIAFPLAGELSATGKTLAEFSVELSRALSEYIRNPQVTVNLIKLRTVRIFVLGEVNRPGMYEIEKSHNLLDAIGMAGGHTKYARRKTVYVVHKATGKVDEVNYSNLIKKGDLSQNITLYEGDVVYLASNGAHFFENILPYITVIYQIRHW
jgi:polysaccharide export outer membrane protein